MPPGWVLLSESFTTAALSGNLYTTWSHFLVCQLKIVVTVVMLVCYANTIMLLGRSILCVNGLTFPTPQLTNH